MSFSWKKAAAAAVGLGLVLSPLAACSSGTSGGTSTTAGGGGGSGALIGVFMPTKTLPRWNRDGADLQKLLEADGYKVSLQYADNKNDQQISQIENVINGGAKVLVIASIDGTTLTPTLAKAAAKGIKVIAYDRLILNTPNVDYYATFDNEKVGTLQGQFIETQLGLKDGKGPFNFEAFAGSPDDNNAKFFFKGAYDVLKPYVDSGKLVSVSGKWPTSLDGWKSIGILGWGSDTAQSEMENRLNSFYTGGKKVQVVLSPNDSLALGISKALQNAGYKAGADYPVLTGQDADLANTVNILGGLQSMTVWKDTRKLGVQAAKMVKQIVDGTTVDVNNTADYNNGVKTVPSYLLDPQVVTKDTVQSALVDSGFWTKKDLGLS
jgi:putative multiple sugar transport system substrate-binding protein